VLAKSVNKKSKKAAESAVGEDEEEDDLSSSDGHDDSSSDEDNAWAKELQRQHKLIKREKLHREMVDAKKAQPKMFELKSSEDFQWNKRRNFKEKKYELIYLLEIVITKFIFFLGQHWEIGLKLRTRVRSLGALATLEKWSSVLGKSSTGKRGTRIK
jgi:hypothetical protein